MNSSEVFETTTSQLTSSAEGDVTSAADFGDSNENTVEAVMVGVLSTVAVVFICAMVSAEIFDCQNLSILRTSS